MTGSRESRNNGADGENAAPPEQTGMDLVSNEARDNGIVIEEYPPNGKTEQSESHHDAHGADSEGGVFLQKEAFCVTCKIPRGPQARPVHWRCLC